MARFIPLIDLVQECYSKHRSLILSPDAIWLAICQGVSVHINKNFKELESVVFVANKPSKLVIREDALLTEPSAWVRITDSLALQANRYTKGGLYSYFVPKFSTTTRVEQTVFTVTMLEAFKKAFIYVGEMGCGIPSITIAGKKEDWVKIDSLLEGFRLPGLEGWINQLKPIIKEFIAASEGKPNRKFWQDIFKENREYNAYYVSGWIIKFFPYIVKNGEVVDEETTRPNSLSMEARYCIY